MDELRTCSNNIMFSHFLHHVASAVSTNRATADCIAVPVRHPGSVVPGVARAGVPCALPVDCTHYVLASELSRERYLPEPAKVTRCMPHQTRPVSELPGNTAADAAQD